VIALVMHLDVCDFITAVKALTNEQPASITPSTPNKSADDYAGAQHRKATRLWSRRRSITGTIGETYLRRARGIACALPPTLGFLPAYKDRAPALIAAFALADEVEPGILDKPRNAAAVHLVLLKSDGSGKAFTEDEVQQGKRNKITVGSPANLPIVIAPPNNLLGLAVTEGIEDGLTAYQATGLGVWAAGTGARMPALANVIPEYIEAVTIFAHADKTGRDGALALAEALVPRGIEVFIEGLR
jgi:putative DNA primase/helicase